MSISMALWILVKGLCLDMHTVALDDAKDLEQLTNELLVQRITRHKEEM